MDDDQLLRYSRHILLDDIGVLGQERLLAAHVVVIGCGGLGCAATLYLASAGVGHLTLVDPDTVDLTNLQRQVAHTMDRLGLSKVESARQAVQAINPQVQITALAVRADAALLDERLPDVDLVLDCSDNFATRQVINAACVRHHKPLVVGAAIAFDGQVSVYDPHQTDSPCYACVFPADSDVQETRCATMGVFAPLVGIVGAMQAAEALKWLSGAGKTLTGRMLMLDARNMQCHEVRLPRQPGCPACGSDRHTP